MILTFHVPRVSASVRVLVWVWVIQHINNISKNLSNPSRLTGEKFLLGTRSVPVFLSCNKICINSEIIWKYFVFLFHNDQMQKFGSTRNKIGFQYSRDLKELYVRDVFV